LAQPELVWQWFIKVFARPYCAAIETRDALFVGRGDWNGNETGNRFAVLCDNDFVTCQNLCEQILQFFLGFINADGSSHKQLPLDAQQYNIGKRGSPNQKVARSQW
jgi:hypothetical protein